MLPRPIASETKVVALASASACLSRASAARKAASRRPSAARITACFSPSAFSTAACLNPSGGRGVVDDGEQLRVDAIALGQQFVERHRPHHGANVGHREVKNREL